MLMFAEEPQRRFRLRPFMGGLLCVAWLTTACSGSYMPAADSGPRDSGSDAGHTDGGFDGGSSQNDGGLALKSACTVLNARRCEYLERCGLISTVGVRDCLAWQQATSCGPSKWPARVEAPVATLRYDAQLAQVCADVWASRKCSDYGIEPTVCGNRFVLPNAFNAQACYDGYKECTEGVCRGNACPRSCQPLGLVSEVCRDNADCKIGLYCRVTTLATGTGVCTEYGQLTKLCDSEQPCVSGLLCNSGKCVQPPVANQPCLGSACDETAWCQSGPDGGQCTARAGLNSSCTDDAQCLTSLLCEVLSGQCVPRVLTAIGAVCGLRQSCPAGAVCLHATATGLGECQPPRDAGSTCMSSNDCQSQLACVGLDGGLALGCGPRQPDGMRCTETRDCRVLSICRQQTCVRLPTTGDSCTLAQRCLFGPCVTTDAGAICTEPFGPGVVCTLDSDCSSSRCVTGKCLPSCTP